MPHSGSSGFSGGFGGSSSGGSFHHGGGSGGPRRSGFFFFPFFFGGSTVGTGGRKGLVSSILLSTLVLLFAVALVVFSILNVLMPARFQNVHFYDYQELLDDYMLKEYENAFDSTSLTYEENALLLILVNDTRDAYAFGTMLGNYLPDGIDRALNQDSTLLKNTLAYYVPQDEYSGESFSSGLATAIANLGDKFGERGLSITPREDEPIENLSHVVNHSQLELDETVLHQGLIHFTEKTGVPLVVVVEEQAVITQRAWFALIPVFLVAGLFIVVSIISIVKSVKGYRKQKKAKDAPQDPATDTSSSSDQNANMWY